MKKIFVLLLAISACTGAKKEDQASAESTTPVAGTEITTQPAQANALTDAQRQEGWKLLFDGQSLQGWQIFKNRKNNTWEAKDGMLHCKPLNEKVKGDGDERSDLMTTEEFQNFEFACEWKISPEGNSGIIYRVTEEFEQPFYSGPEYQLIDDQGYKPKQEPVHLTGANYDMQAPDALLAKPIGEWNLSRIVVNGKQVEHWLNGQKVVAYELGSADWKKRKEASKWKDAKGYGMATKGHIDLQDHGHEIWFRNVMVKAL
ncbi:MAG: DUF1080 domain-containing protein [Bacteroidetes bacterium]|nr:DUF1080 domain-containing protein [Bacteroidota bacterium]MBS1541306.1 DUF1080 domain-containing protein [Bacteroidota bacterium]